MADDNSIDTRGIMDPGAAGAAGAVNGLWTLMAARRQAQLLAEAQRRYDAQQAQQQEENSYQRRRLDQGDARQAALDAKNDRAAKDAENRATLGQITARPGAMISGDQLATLGVGPDSPLRNTVFASAPQMFATRRIAGYAGTPGSDTATKGAVNMEDTPGVGSNMFRVTPTLSDDLKQDAADLANRKADIQRMLGEAKTEAEKQHWSNMLDIANQRIQAAQDRATAADARRNTLTPSQTLNEITQLNKAYNANTKGERTIVGNYGQMQQALKSLDDPNVQNQTAATKSIVDAFERTLNPNAVVRQTAFAQDVGHQSALDSLWGKWQQLTAGGHGMTPQNLRAFAAQVEPLARAAQQKIAREKTRITNMATPYSLPIEQIFAEEDDPFASGASAPPGTTPSTSGATPPGYDAYMKRYNRP